MACVIHPTAIVEPGAQLGNDVTIGAYALIGSEVKLGDRCQVQHHACIIGKTQLGHDNVFAPFAVIGSVSQDLKYTVEPTYLKIGNHNTFREFMTVNRGTAPDSTTEVGSHNTFLAYTHIAHDCLVADHCVFSNNATLGGHVQVDHHVTIGGMTAIHQFCRIGRYAMVGGCSKIVQDVPPYFLADGNPAQIRSINLIGLKRHDFPLSKIRELRTAFRCLYDEGMNTSQALNAIENNCAGISEIKALLDFVHHSERGIIR
jgi:UDP-N-acetylglucosamine acyltransferase